MSNTSTQPDLAALAAFAWAALAEGRTNAHESLDWLREQSGSEDVKALKKAVYMAAEKSIPPAPNDEWSETAPWFRQLLRRGNLDGCVGIPDVFRSLSDHADWVAWCDSADAALALCRAIEGLPE